MCGIYLPVNLITESCTNRENNAVYTTGDGLGKCNLSRNDHNRKIRTRKQRTDVGKYSSVNRTIESWKQLPAGLLASFPCKINTFRSLVRCRSWLRFLHG